MEPERLADRMAAILDNKKALRIEKLDITKRTPIADFFVVCSGTSTTHVRALADELQFQLNREGISVGHVEGYDSARWILLDYGDVAAHIFVEQERDFYSLERLWSPANFRLRTRLSRTHDEAQPEGEV